ncbi:homeobox domain-containing protein, partial [Mycotypha africana]|uniref:homeobox domain-containing protein n=1 Tax=Mycotypha africana TaxID=64632 RepID=UPI00230077B3
RPKRKRITPDQLHILTELFQQTDTPNHDLREKIAKKLNMTNREVQVWFQNRRAKVNRLRLQQQQQQQ